MLELCPHCSNPGRCSSGRSGTGFYVQNGWIEGVPLSSFFYLQSCVNCCSFSTEQSIQGDILETEIRPPPDNENTYTLISALWAFSRNIRNKFLVCIDSPALGILVYSLEYMTMFNSTHRPKSSWHPSALVFGGISRFLQEKVSNRQHVLVCAGQGSWPLWTDSIHRAAGLYEHCSVILYP